MLICGGHTAVYHNLICGGQGDAKCHISNSADTWLVISHLPMYSLVNLPVSLYKVKSV